jgi:NAD(P)H-hydrate epimerase
MAAAVNESGDWDAGANDAAIALLEKKNAVCIGCGVGDGDVTPLIARALEARLPLVLDADALNQISQKKELLNRLHENVILTPHPAEMARLTGETMDEILRDPVEVARCYAKRWSCVVLLKGATTCVSNGACVRLNTTGNPGLAKGGSGDVLSGIITALLAQGLSALDAASAGAYLLGASADTALELLNTRMLMARDVIDAVQKTISLYFS